jgi:hypothetical protein
MINTLSEPIIFADDTRVIIYSKNLNDYILLNRALIMYKWFTANKLALNLNIRNKIKFTINNPSQYPLNIQYNKKYLEQSVNTKLFVFPLDYHLNWKNHINQLVPKLSGALRALLLISNTDILKSIYLAYFHSIINCGIIFWDNSCSSKKIFSLQKKIIRIMAGVKPRNSWRGLLKR